LPTENAYSPNNPDKKTLHRLKPKEEWLAISVPPLIEQDTFAPVQSRMQHNSPNPLKFNGLSL